MPDFDGARRWVGGIDANPRDKSRLKSWIDKIQEAYQQLENSVDSLSAELINEAGAVDRLRTLEEAIQDHRRGIIDTAELHDLVE